MNALAIGANAAIALSYRACRCETHVSLEVGLFQVRCHIGPDILEKRRFLMHICPNVFEVSVFLRLVIFHTCNNQGRTR